MPDYDMRGEGHSVLLPEGWHKVLVTDVILQMSKSNNEMWVITTEEPESGSVDTVYAITTPKKRWILKSFLDAAGFKKDSDGVYKNVEMADCVGITVEANNKPEANEFVNRAGETIKEMRNKFISFRATTEKATL
jgi:hypothetical protein